MLHALVSYLRRIFVHSHISIKDVERMKLEETAEKLDIKFFRAWRKEIVLTKREKRPPSLLSMIHRLYFWTIYLTGFGMLLLHLVTVFLFPSLVEFFITYLIGSDDFKVSERTVWFNAIGLCSCAFVICTFKSSMSENLKSVSVSIKGALSCLIYRKILRMKKDVKYGLSEEEIAKLLSEDTEKVGNGLEQVHSLWLAMISFFTVSRALYILFDSHTGLFSPFVPGLIVIAVTTMLHSSKIKLCSRVQSRVEYLSNLRKRLTEDVVKGMDVIRVNVWEKPYTRLFERLRAVEVQQLQLPALATSMMSNTSFSHIHVLVLLCSVVSTAAVGQTMTIEKVVLTSIFFYILHANVARDFPVAFESVIDMFYSSLKIQAFLFIDDVPNRIKSETWVPESTHGNNKTGLRFCDVVVASFAGQKKEGEDSKDQILLQGIDLVANKGELVCLAGPPASGKTTLLLTAAGEIASTFGLVRTSGHVLYVPQEDWIFKGTIRENILCHQQYNEEKYRNIIQICQLQDEFIDFMKGDETYITNDFRFVSSSTRVKINIARSLYADADVYLFDDILGVFDQKEVDHFFRVVVRDHLKEKLCLVVTNQEEHMKVADKVILLKNGKVCAFTNYDNFTDADRESVSSHRPLQDAGEENSKDCDTDRDNWYAIDRRSHMFVCFASFLRFGGNMLVLTILIGMLVLSQCTFHLSDWLLFDLVDERSAVVLQPLQPDGEESEHVTQHFRVETAKSKSSIDSYFICELAFVWFCMFSGLVLLVVLKNALIRIHSVIVRRIMKDSGTFSTHTVRTLLKCLQTLDQHIMFSVAGIPDVLLPVCGILIFTVFVCPSLVMPTLIYALVVTGVGRSYAKTYRNLKEIETQIQSSSKRHLLETIERLVSIRAVSLAEGFHKTFLQQQNKRMSAAFITQVTDSLLAGRVQFLSFVYLALVANFVFRRPELFAKDGIQIVLTFWAVIDSIPKLIQAVADMEYRLPQLKWLIELTEKETENPDYNHLIKFKVRRGRVHFHNVIFQPGIWPFLNINTKIQECEKVGIICSERKDLFVRVLLGALPPTSGSLYIDNINIYNLYAPSHELRNIISVVGMQKVIFSTSVQNNLDPKNLNSRGEIWEALDYVGLKSIVEALPKQLNSDIRRHLQLQPYQKYLMSLARGILTNKKLVIISDFYPSTEASRTLIRSTIKDKFANSTVVFITSKPCADLMVEFDNIYCLVRGVLQKLG
ncbi:ATP-binding cassette sub-family C member 4-like [Glandiceps talaboti]